MLQQQQLEVFDYSPPQPPIIRMPNRKFPGYLIEGDNLNDLLKSAVEVQQRLRGESSQDELISYADRVAEILTRMLAHYEKVLIHNNIPLPYDPPLSIRKKLR